MAIIPARGGSRGVPRKNLHLLAGRPLVAHSIEHARQAPGVERVVVSTDDEEIAAVSRRFGAEVVWRPPEISGDTATSESALLHVLEHLQQAEGYEPDLVVFLQATSPLRRADDVQNAIETLAREGADSLLSVCPISGFVWARVGETVTPVTYDYRRRPRRQDMPEYLAENGSIYVFKPWVLRQFHNRLGGRIAAYRMDPLDLLELDEPADRQRLEQLLELRRPQPGAPDLGQIRLLVLDFDGVLTDNRVLVDETGKEAVWCHRGDGWGIARLREAGVEVGVISTETNGVVTARCRKLGLEVVHGCRDKRAALEQMAARHGVQAEHVAYVGNDGNDLDCMTWAGVPVAVADATPDVRTVARLITARTGGDAAVREIVDRILEAKASKGGRRGSSSEDR